MKIFIRLLPFVLSSFLLAQSPSITSFSPSSAVTGTVVTITGTGFSSTMSDNIVYFGAGKGTVTFANATTLDVTVPNTATYGPITVSVIGSGKVAISENYFNLKFSAGDIDAAALTFDQTISLGGIPLEPDVIDMNGDGKLDLLVTRGFNSPLDARTVAYLQNTSSGGNVSFAPTVEIPTPSVPRKNYFGTEDNRLTDPRKIITSDLDGDGKKDFVIVTKYGVSVQRDIGTPGNPNFQLWQEFLNPDMTGGSWQMIRGSIHNIFIKVLFSTMGGASAGRTGAMGRALPLSAGGVGGAPSGFPDNHYVWVPNYLTNMTANDAVIADFNADSKPDIAIVYSGFHGSPEFSVGGRLRVFLNGGSTFNLATDLDILEPEYMNELDAYSIAAADFDQNDTMDVVVAGNFDAYTNVGMVTVLANAMGDGTSFIPVRNWIVSSRVERVVAGDFDGDTKIDIAYQSMNDNKIRIRRNTSPSDDMTFSEPFEISLHNGYRSMQISDFDGDGKPDLLWACEGASGFKAARNTSSPGTISFTTPLHVITSLEFQDAIAVADFSGDGKPDVISTRLSTGELSVIKNTIPPYSLSQSLVSVTTPVIAKNGSTPVSLQIKDASGNNLGTTGLTITFGLTGSGTSSGIFGATGDVGGGVYSALFGGTNVGTAKNVTASINGSPVSSSLPTVRVAGGSNSVAQSTVTISRPIVASGATAIVIFQAKDTNGDTLTTGGLAGVTFFLAGSGTSSGTFGSVVDSSNGKYYATFTASTSGTAKNIRARIGTDTTQTTQPTVTVIPGIFSTANSVISIASNSIMKYDTTTVTLQVKDGSGNNITTGGLNVKIEIFGSGNPLNNGKAYLTSVVDNQNGTYTSKLIGLTVSTGTAITASIYNSGTTSYQSVNSFPAPVSVTARPVSLSLSTVVVGATNGKTVPSSTVYFYLYLKNDKGEAYTATNPVINFSLVSDGTSAGFATTAPTNIGGGTYQMGWQGTIPGTPRTVTVTIDGNSVTSTLPTIAVVPFGPGVTYPTYSQQAIPIDTTFYWDASTGATNYRVQIVADSLSGSVIIDSAGITTTSYHVIGLRNFRKYYFRLMAMHAGIDSEIWNERDFTTIISAPAQIFPSDREEHVGLPVGFGWIFGLGADSYQLQVATDTGFLSLVIDKIITDSVTTDTISGFATNTKYFWRVNATGGSGTTEYSTIRSFTTASIDSFQQRYYVKSDGNDASAGTSWGTAFATVQQALTMAGMGTHIWVAAGTYKPTTTNDRSISFQLKNGVAIYGGFAGTETNIDQRNWQSNVTILSGDIDGDATLANNSFHVVVGSSIYASSVLDGFTITGGNADGGQRGGGLYCSSAYPVLSNLIISGNYANDFGGGMYNQIGNPTLTNVTFSGNTCGDRGGGVYSERGTPAFVNCSFIGNNAFDGGGMWNGTSFYPGTSNAAFTNVTFKNNISSHFGGGIYTEYSNPNFNNVLFYQNSSGSGGGIYILQGNSNLSNITFSKNSASDPLQSGGGGMYIWLSSVTLKNVILWGNSGSPLYNGEIINAMNSTVTLYNSLVQDGMPVHGGFGIHNYFGGVDVDSGGNVYTDPLFINALSGDLKLSNGSPAIDAGINTVVTTISDLGNDPRIVGSTVDMGAYEFQSSASSVANAIIANDSSYQFGGTNVKLSFSGIAPGKKILAFASHFQTAPDSATFTGSTPSSVSTYRWVIAKTGDIFSSASITLSNVSSFPGVVDPSSLIMYRRDTAGIGNFSPLTTTYNGVSDKLSTTITSFSEFILGSNDNPLSVELTSFIVTPNRLNAELKWNTTMEVNNYGFEVERKVIGVSGFGEQTINPKTQTSKQEWGKTGFVEGRGTSNAPKEYSFTDKNLAAGKYSYRLKQIDRDGKFLYSQEVEVEIGKAPRVFTLSQNYPNPFNPSTSIEFTLPDDGRATMKLYDILGREVAKVFDDDAKAGVYQKVAIDGTRMASGVYFVRIEYKNKALLKKMMLIK